MSIVIAGGGLAALRALEDLRHLGWTGDVVVVSDERVSPYNRPPLSKELLWGKETDEDVIFEVSEAANQNTEWRFGAAVVASDLDRKEITLSDGTILPFDGLVVATGVSSRRLDFPGPAEGRTVLRSLDDAHRVEAALQAGQRVVVLGAGFIGCEVAATARKQGCEVDLVAIDPCSMFVPLGQEIGSEIQRRHELTGARFHMGRTISATEGDGRVQAVVLDDGTRLEADLLLETVGSVPNTAWLDGNGLDLANGVLVDESLRVGGRTGVVAAGDVARFANPLFGAPPLRIEHWQTAIDTAGLAVRTLLHDLGATDAEAPIASVMPWFWSDQGDVRITSFGMLGLADRTETLEGELSDECAVGYFRGDEAVGVVLVGMKSKSARYKRWLANERKRVLAGG